MNLNDTWRKQAACKGLDPDMFFPERGGSTREAKALCAECKVSVECDQFAVSNGEKFGIWGGRSERQRKARARAEGTVRGTELKAAS